MKLNSQKINRYIFLLASGIATLILVNGGFAFWQMNQVKKEFYDVANWDLPLVARLSPLIDRQVEQTLLLEKMLQPGVPQRTMKINTLKNNFIHTGEKFEKALEQLNGFIVHRLSSGRKEAQAKMKHVKQLLGRVANMHGNYQSGILNMMETVKAGHNDYEPDRFTLLFKIKKSVLTEAEKELRLMLLNLRDEVQEFTQQSAAAVESHENRVIRGVVLFTFFTCILGTLFLFILYKVMQSRDKAVAEITYYATHDPLTKLINRRYFFVRLNEAVKTAQRYNRHLSLCVCDLDHFKAINDLMGHQAGDNVLTGFGQIINKEKRTEDIAGRFGGDEFVICFPDTPAKDTVNLLERIRESFEKKGFQNGADKPFYVTATFGVADIDPGNPKTEVLLAAADKALYQAKKNGRNRVVCL